MSEKYRPSNGSEGESFMAEWCETCALFKDEDDEYCEIAGATYAFDVDDEGYPSEWIYDDQGKPCCTAYLHNSEKIPVPRCTRTKDMFENNEG